jgi:hypothetical protein
MCRRVVFSSDGLVGSTLSSYLGRYYFTLVDETGRLVYQHEKGDTFLHYINDPPHRYLVRFLVIRNVSAWSSSNKNPCRLCIAESEY